MKAAFCKIRAHAFAEMADSLDATNVLCLCSESI